ncbi:MAG TPA: SRPBCC domain-containing protein [Candidatus Dormibacteraeota bacterium]
MTVIAVDRDPVALTVTIVAEFSTTAERVWQVWADPRQLERWWGPPGYPATVVDHDLADGGRVNFYMTGPDGEKLHGWWRIISVDQPRSLQFEEGCGPPYETLPSNAVQVQLSEAPGKTTMTITMRFASIADMEQLLAMGKDDGTRRAVGQIDAILEQRVGRGEGTLFEPAC